jgi:hypothetical protein
MGLITLYLVFGLGICSGLDLRQLQEVYRSLLSSDDSHLPDLAKLARQQGDGIFESASAEDLAAFVPVIRQCLQSRRDPVIGEGLSFLFGLSLKPMEASQLLAPYIDDMGALMTSPEAPFRNMALLILSYYLPPSAKGLEYLIVHFKSKDIPNVEVGVTANVILYVTSGANLAVIHTVLQVVREKRDPELTSQILTEMINFPLRGDEALQFIRMSLTDDSLKVRTAAIHSIGALKPEARSLFFSELQHIRTNPTEATKTRDLADKVLTQQDR